MKTKLNTRMLSFIALQITSGKPLWGLLTANEYLETDCALRSVLMAKAQAAAEINRMPKQLCDLILEGTRLGDLPPHTQELIRHQDREASKAMLRQSTLEAARHRKPYSVRKVNLEAKQKKGTEPGFSN